MIKAKSKVILLGNKYKLLDEDMSVIQKHFSSFTQVGIDNSNVNKDIKNALTKTKNIIVLNNSLKSISSSVYN